MGLKVLVVGASSGVGLQVTKALIRAGEKYEVFALVRSQEKTSRALGFKQKNSAIDRLFAGRAHILYPVRVVKPSDKIKGMKSTGSDASAVKFIHGDITKKESLMSACQDIDAIVCSVGAQAGWRLPGCNQYTPKYVDYMGVQYLIEAAVEARVQKFVYVSSIAITRPWSFVHLFLNTLFGRVLYWKNLAEQALREAYKDHDHLAYYIVRPGGLNDKEGGQHGIIFEQGDTGIGSITRPDVATVCLACINEECPPNVTFEIVNDMKSPAGDQKAMSTLVPDRL